MCQFAELRKELLKETREKIKASVTDDVLIIQAATSLEQVEQAANTLAKKAREWYGLTAPESERLVRDHAKLLELATSGKRRAETMGATLAKQDEEALQNFLNSIRGLYDERSRLQAYIEHKMEEMAPNFTELAGAAIGAKLLAHAGSFKKLAIVPSSTIQLYGAETALFRHLRSKRHKSPKYGLLFNHPLVQHTKERGKAARALADKLSICAKLDYFKGDKKAAEYKQQLAARFGGW